MFGLSSEWIVGSRAQSLKEMGTNGDHACDGFEAATDSSSMGVYQKLFILVTWAIPVAATAR
jgi:hypothetical protein